jgi:hypothetical protein
MHYGEIIDLENGFFLRRAVEQDIPDLLTLYFKLYGANYPLAIGTDRAVMTRILSDNNNLWVVAVSRDKKILCGSAVFEVDTTYRIGRAEGLVVHPEFQQLGLASTMLHHGSKFLLEDSNLVNSIYTTTRTLSVSPQLVFLNNGYIPLGIFPNAHRLAVYETLSLMAKFHSDVLTKRKVATEVPEALGPIIKTVDKFIRSTHPSPKLLKLVKPQPCGEHLEFELIHAPEYVQRKFFATFTDPYDRFYPFHKPNFLMSAKNGEVDIYGYLSKTDGYCTIVVTTKPVHSMAGRLRPLMQQLRDFGVSYLEILMQTDNILSLETLLDANFLPSAIYPAMMEVDNQFVDLVLMSRTMEPLNFRGMNIEKSFKPYIDQYISLWKAMHLEVLGVFNEK